MRTPLHEDSDLCIDPISIVPLEYRANRDLDCVVAVCKLVELRSLITDRAQVYMKCQCEVNLDVQLTFSFLQELMRSLL